MRCNLRRWLWGAIPLLVLSLVAVEVEHARLEEDLARRAALALSQAGLGWGRVEFAGRSGVLSGRALQEGEPAKAAGLVRGLWGVRGVENRASVIEKAEHYHWSASRRNHRIRLSGYVPNADARQAILGVTKASFPGFEVTDEMTLARGVPAGDMWLGGISFALQQLAALKRGDVRLDDLGLGVAGEAEDVAAYRATKTALGAGLPKGIKLLGEEVTPPVITPYTWAAEFSDGRLMLSGHVPNEGERAHLLDAAKAATPNAQPLDQMQLGVGAPRGFTAAAMASLRELPRLASGSAELRGPSLIVAGIARDQSTAAAVRDALRAALPASITFGDEIKAPPPSAAAPSAAEGPSAEVAPAQGLPTSEPPRAALAATPPSSGPPVAAPPLPSGSPAAVAPPASGSGVPVAADAREPAPSGLAREPAASGLTSSEATPPEAPPAPRVVSSGDAASHACADALASAAKAGTILFRIGSAELDPSSIPTLDRLAQAAQFCPDMRIEVGGHASAEGGEAVNRRLSLRRAQSVVAYLIRAGVDRQRLDSAGYGATRPIMRNDTEAHMARNRRIEFTVRPK
jgi:outer membrane protein OmpA-like peptidoglycan-associated protein/osmotically-inducible protein OsmY